MKKLLAALLLFLAAAAPAAGQGLSDLPPSTNFGPITNSSLLWACTNPPGCHSTDPTITAGSISFGQLVSFLTPTFLTTMSAVPPLSFNSSTGAFSLLFDSTLSLVGSQLHVVSSGGGGSGTVSAGTGPAIAQYNSGTGTTVGPATISGDATLAQGGALSLATVNSNVGTFAVPTITVNNKGLITAVSAGSAVNSVTGTAGQVTCSPTTGSVICGLASVISQPTNFTGGLQINGANVVSGPLSSTSGNFAIWNGTGGALIANGPAVGTMASQNAGAVAITGGSITGLPTPVSSADAVNKAYVDGAIVGVIYHTQAVVNTGAAVLPNTPTYNNGTAGVGATLTSATNTALVVNGYTVLLNDRVLVKDQAAQAQNGIYVQTQLGTGSVPWILTRATDFNTAAPGNVATGAYVFTALGTVTPASAWVMTTSGAITIGTTALAWTQVGGIQTGGISGPASSTNLNVPQWNGIGGNALFNGLPVATASAANSLVETGAGGTLSNTFISGLPNANLANSSITIAGHPVALGGSQNLACGDLTGSGTACTATTGTSGHVLGFLDGANTYSGIQSFTSGDLVLLGGTSGSTTLTAPATGGGLATLFPGTDTVAGIAATQTLTNKTVNCANNTCTVRANLDLTGTLQAAQFPALTGDVTTVAGSLATTIASGAVTNAKLSTGGTVTINGTACTLGSSCSPSGGGSTISNANVTAAGTNIGTCAGLTATVNVINSATAGSATGVCLAIAPAAPTSTITYVFNTTNVTVNVFPTTGSGVINNLAAGGALQLLPGSGGTIVSVSATQWYSIP